MGILRVEGLMKAFGIETLFTGVSFELGRGDKMGLIGGNGTGKTTLLRCLLGLESRDGGQVVVPTGETIGYVQQDASLNHGTLYEELSSAYQDVLGWQERMRELEQIIADHQDEDALAGSMKEYAQVVEKFERGGGYEYENIIRRVAFGLGFTNEDISRALDAGLFGEGSDSSARLFIFG